MLHLRTVLTKGFTTAVLGVVVCGVRADAAPADVGQVMAIGCRIRVTAEDGAIRLEAVAKAREDASGRYRFDIAKTSASGSSRNVQSGDFRLEADKEEVLSTTLLGASDAGHFQAKLVLDSSFGSVSCVSP
jgi:hypothetical protein